MTRFGAKMKETFFGHEITIENGFETYTDEGGIYTLRAYRGDDLIVRVPDGIQNIFIGAFSNSNVEEVILPESVLMIGDRAFRDCINLKSCIIPESVQSIMGEAFANCPSLLNVSFPSRLRYLGKSAFRRAGIETAVFPAGIKKTLGSVFAECENLTKAIIVEPEMVLNTGEFSGCDKLKDIYYDGEISNLPPLIKHKIQKKKTIFLHGLQER